MPPEWAPEMASKFGIPERDVWWLSEEFRDHWCNATGKGRLKSDWKAAFRNSIRNKLSWGYKVPANYQPPGASAAVATDRAKMVAVVLDLESGTEARIKPHGWQKILDVPRAVLQAALDFMREEGRHVHPSFNVDFAAAA
jgi:hypothetical protein